MPKIQVKSSARPSLYAYPAMLPEKKKEERERVTATAVLSTSSKHRGRSAPSSAASTASTKKDLTSITSTPMEVGMEAGKSGDAATTAKEKPEPKEPTEEMIENPARILPQQLKVISLEDPRYKPLKPISLGGIILLQDRQPDQPQEFLEPVVASGPQIESQGDEPPPPEPFEYTED